MAERFLHGYGLIIGVGADLPVTATDAEAVHAQICDPRRCAYEPAHVALLTQGAATRSGILQELDILSARVKSDPDATVVIYFSGHGITTPDFFLLPFGYNLHDLASTAIPGGLFNEKLRAIQSRKLIVLLDCCHAAGHADPMLAKVAAPLPVDMLEQLRRGSGRVVIASSRKDEYSYTGDPYSVFTTALLEGLAGYGAFEYDGYARVLDLAMYLGRVIPARTDEKQHPVLKVSNLEDNFAVAYYAAGATKHRSLDWYSSPSPTTHRQNTAQMQAQTWRRMLASRRTALLLLQERISEYIVYQDIPLQLIQNQRRTEVEIADLEEKLGLR